MKPSCAGYSVGSTFVRLGLLSKEMSPCAIHSSLTFDRLRLGKVMFHPLNPLIKVCNIINDEGQVFNRQLSSRIRVPLQDQLRFVPFAGANIDEDIFALASVEAIETNIFDGEPVSPTETLRCPKQALHDYKIQG